MIRSTETCSKTGTNSKTYMHSKTYTKSMTIKPEHLNAIHKSAFVEWRKAKIHFKDSELESILENHIKKYEVMHLTKTPYELHEEFQMLKEDFDEFKKSEEHQIDLHNMKQEMHKIAYLYENATEDQRKQFYSELKKHDPYCQRAFHYIISHRYQFNHHNFNLTHQIESIPHLISDFEGHNTTRKIHESYKVGSEFKEFLEEIEDIYNPKKTLNMTFHEKKKYLENLDKMLIDKENKHNQHFSSFLGEYVKEKLIDNEYVRKKYSMKNYDEIMKNLDKRPKNVFKESFLGKKESKIKGRSKSNRNSRDKEKDSSFVEMTEKDKLIEEFKHSKSSKSAKIAKSGNPEFPLDGQPNASNKVDDTGSIQGITYGSDSAPKLDSGDTYGKPLYKIKPAVKPATTKPKPSPTPSPKPSKPTKPSSKSTKSASNSTSPKNFNAKNTTTPKIPNVAEIASKMEAEKARAAKELFEKKEIIRKASMSPLERAKEKAKEAKQKKKEIENKKKNLKTMAETKIKMEELMKGLTKKPVKENIPITGSCKNRAAAITKKAASAQKAISMQTDALNLSMKMDKLEFNPIASTIPGFIGMVMASVVKMLPFTIIKICIPPLVLIIDCCPEAMFFPMQFYDVLNSRDSVSTYLSGTQGFQGWIQGNGFEDMPEILYYICGQMFNSLWMSVTFPWCNPESMNLYNPMVIAQLMPPIMPQCLLMCIATMATCLVTMDKLIPCDLFSLRNAIKSIFDIPMRLEIEMSIAMCTFIPFLVRWDLFPKWQIPRLSWKQAAKNKKGSENSEAEKTCPEKIEEDSKNGKQGNNQGNNQVGNQGNKNKEEETEEDIKERKEAQNELKQEKKDKDEIELLNKEEDNEFKQQRIQELKSEPLIYPITHNKLKRQELLIEIHRWEPNMVEIISNQGESVDAKMMRNSDEVWTNKKIKNVVEHFDIFSDKQMSFHLKRIDLEYLIDAKDKGKD